MSFKYSGPIPDRNYSLNDFYDKRIILWMFCKFKTYDNIPSLRIVFRSNGLIGEIRTTCYGNTYAVDVEWGWWSDRRRCLTTECKSLREAKSILFMWFKSKGYNRTEEQIANEQYASYLSLNNIQLTFNPLYLNGKI
jgi:hypothetical protein